MLLIFDCDGVIIDSTILHTEAEAECFQKLGITLTQRQLKERFAGVSDADVFRALETETGIKIPADMRSRLDQEKRVLFGRKLKVMPGLQDILEDIRNIPSCVASGSSVNMLSYTLTLTNLVSFFGPRIFSADMVSRGKPFPDLFLYAAARMGVRPEDCIIIEDSRAGVQAGKAAGSKVIGFFGGSHCDEHHGDMLLEAGADYTLSFLGDLPDLLKSIHP